MQIDKLIKRLKDRVQLVQEPLGPVLSGRGAEWKYTMHPPAELERVLEAEHVLGFPLPSVLRRVLLEVGNGHYGSCYGLCPLSSTSAPDAVDQTIVELYLDAISLPDYLADGCWPRDVLPVWEWGGGIFSCLDRSSPDADDPMVVRYDVNGEIAPARFSRRRKDIPLCFLEEGMSFSEWLIAWLDEVDLVSRPYGVTDP